MDFHGFFRDELLECSPAKVAEKESRFTSCCRWGSGTQRVNPQHVWQRSNNTRLSSIFMIITILLSRSTATTATNQQSSSSSSSSSMIIWPSLSISGSQMNIVATLRPCYTCGTCSACKAISRWRATVVEKQLRPVIGSFHPMAEFSRLNPCLEMSLSENVGYIPNEIAI